MEKVDDLTGILVTIQVDGVQVLYIAVFADGTLHRMGTGSEDNTEKDLFIGQSSAALFQRLRDRITPDLLRRVGAYADPSPKGKACELTVGFQKADGEELLSQWKYGSASLGPPPEVRRVVMSAIEATDPWYEQQKRLKKSS
jgi:hypothetical protein